MLKHKFILTLFILVFIVLLELILLNKNILLDRNRPSKTDKLLTQYAEEILAKCTSFTHHQTCYDKEIPVLMEQPAGLTLEEAFEVTRLVQQKDPSFPYCHVLGHNLSAKEVKKDPTKWKEVVTRCPSGLCSNGCIHGGFQEKFRAESFTDTQIQAVKPDLIDLCEKRGKWNPTGLEQASCYHALGHLTMYLTDANTGKSVKLCEEITLKDDGRDLKHLCYDGVFMQIFQPLEPEDFALVKGKQPAKQDVESFCSKYEGKIKGSCLSESWPLYRQEILDDPKGLVNFCSRSAKDQQKRCYASLVYVLTGQMNFDSDKIKKYCLGLPQTVQEICFANAASRMIETDYRYIEKSVDFCSRSETSANKEACFQELLKYSTYNFHKGSEEFFALCNSLPDVWKTKCLSKS